MQESIQQNAGLLDRTAALLSQHSIFSLTLGRVRFRGRRIFDDRVRILQHSPLGMFFYNQRAIFFGLSFVFMVAVGVLVFYHASEYDEGIVTQMKRTVWVLAATWGAATVLTVLRHGPFRNKLEQWDAAPMPGDLPSLFDLYFIADLVLLLVLLAAGRLLNLEIDEFAFLLFANTVVYAAYVGGGRRSRKLMTGITLLVPSLAFLFFLGTRIEIREPRWFYLTIYLGTLIGMWLLSLLSVLMISWLRTTENGVTKRHLEMLGRYEEMLSGPDIRNRVGDGRDEYGEEQFNSQVTEVLEDLCNQRPSHMFWYDSACLWYLEEHKDRGEVLLAGPQYKFPEAEQSPDGRDLGVGLLSTHKIALLPSLKYRSREWQGSQPEFRADRDIPAAFIPLKRKVRDRTGGFSRVRVGVLALYGKEGGPPLLKHEEAFLNSLGKIISNTMEQWQGRFRELPQTRMDDLFKCKTLDEVFSNAVVILKDCLMAAGCMVVFRPDPDKEEMEIRASDEFGHGLKRDHYRVGRDQTGKCAQTGETIRFDDVSTHRDEFDMEHLAKLAAAHGKRIRSWMAIPIGTDRNYGVIKVVNSTVRCYWFTDYDERLGEELALRLLVIIEKFVQFKETQEARAQAEKNAVTAKKHADEALRLQKKWEAAAKQRQMDLLTLTHQLQAPLVPVIGYLSLISGEVSAKNIREQLADVQILVEDVFILCWGLVNSLANEGDADEGDAEKSHRKKTFKPSMVNATEEMKLLCERLRMTNSREDLTFGYHRVDDFPTLRIDRNVFTSVLFSLVHNAMKYAAHGSEVSLICGFEKGEPTLKVKSKGERILQGEEDLIFEKFKRGRAVEKGRKHGGVGLGLWVARELMRAVEGNLTVEIPSGSPDFSIFIIHFPNSDHVLPASPGSARNTSPPIGDHGGR